MAFAVAGDNGPWGVLCGCAAHDVVYRDGVLGPFFAVAPVFVGELPGLGRVIAAALEAGDLFLAADVNPELHDHKVAAHKLLLEVVDFLKGTLRFREGAESFDAFDKHAAVPASVENGYIAGLGQLRPETP